MTGSAHAAAASARTRRFARATTTFALAAVGSLLVGCGDDETTSSKPRLLTITTQPVGAKGAEYVIPAGVKAGVVTITVRNATKFPREAQLLRIEGEHSAAEVKRIVDSEDAPIPSWLRAAGGVTDLKPNAAKKVTLDLAAGSYYVTDTSDPDFEATPARLGRFEVAAGDSQAKLPAVPAQITAREYSFAATNLKAGTSQVLFRNTGKEVHHAIMFPMIGDAKIADVSKFFQTEGKTPGPPPVDFETGTSLPAIDGGTEQVSELTLRSGRYAAVCFVTDRAGGPPHFAKGQVTELTVE